MFLLCLWLMDAAVMHSRGKQAPEVKVSLRRRWLRNLTSEQLTQDAGARLRFSEEMKENFNLDMLPIIQDNMSYLPAVRSTSSNGYYGYQPPVLEKQEEVAPEETHTAPCRMEFENCLPLPQNQNLHRKRTWESSNDFREFKKRRQNEYSSLVYQQVPATSSRDVELRKPTHNIPDLPRCIMGHYI